MRALAEYIVSVSAAAFLCGIVNSLMPKGTAKEVLKLVGGLFLAFTVIRPIADLQIPELSEVADSWQEEAQQAAAMGQSMAQELTAEGIKSQLEAYILDKAEELRLELEVEIALQEESLLPEQVRLKGNASPHAKQQMTRYIRQELGVAEEDILWIG